MQELNKSRLLLFPLIIGIALIVYSWFLSCPLSINSLNDFVFNNISIFYWIGLPLTLAAMFIMAVTFKSHYSRWIIIVSIVVAIYSLSYFYYMLPGSDSHYFRGLNEYFIKTKDLNPTEKGHSYFQWPSFFLLNDIATSVTGLELMNFEFLLYTIIGFLIATALYVYFSKAYRNGSFLAVAAFFVAMFYFLNYQCVPFSLALGLLFLMLMLETKQKNFGVTLTMMVFYTGISFMHAFVPLFFVLYLLIRCILDRSKMYGRLFVLTLIIYLVVQITQAPYSFAQNIKSIFSLETEYSKIVEATLAPASVPIDILAQMFSRIVTITAIAMCLAGFMILLIKKKLGNLDKAIFITGAAYTAVGSIFYLLGSRAIPIIFIPISLGAAYLLEGRFRKYIASLFLVLLVLFTFILLHSAFYDSQIMFQTKEAYQMENFMIERYNWTINRLILAHVRVITYLRTKQPSVVNFENDVNSPLFPRINEYDSIVYTVGLGKNLLKYNYTTERILHEEILNVVYNNGFSYIAEKS